MWIVDERTRARTRLFRAPGRAQENKRVKTRESDESAPRFFAEFSRT